MPTSTGPDVVPLRSREQLTELYRDVLEPSFPPTELVALQPFLDDHASGASESLGVLDDGGAVVAGVVASWSAPTRVLLVQYLAIAPGRRGTGIGGALLDAAISSWQDSLEPLVVLGEVEHPDHHAASEGHGDPAARLRFYARHSGRILPIPYFQPGTGPGKERVPALLLMALRTADPDASTLPAAPLRAFLEEHFRESEGTLADDAATRALLGSLAGEQVALLDVADLAQVPVGLLDAASSWAPPGSSAPSVPSVPPVAGPA